MKKAKTQAETIAAASLIARFVDVTLVDDGCWYRVSAGDQRAGQRGKVIAIIGFKHTGGYEVVMQMENGKTDSFSPTQLLVDTGHPDNQRISAERSARKAPRAVEEAAA
jgi:hypothetical protein